MVSDTLADQTDVAERVAYILGPSSAAAHALARKADAECAGYQTRLTNSNGVWVLHQWKVADNVD